MIVTDDEPGFRRFVRKVAERAGWDVIECENGLELMEKIQEETNPSLVILDLVMPKMDGLQSINWLSEINNSIPICLVTGGPLEPTQTADVLAAAKDMRIRNMLKKPLRLSDLNDVLDFADF